MFKKTLQGENSMKKLLMTAAFALVSMTSTGVMAADNPCDKVAFDTCSAAGNPKVTCIKAEIAKCQQAALAAAPTPEEKAKVFVCDEKCMASCDEAALKLGKKPSDVAGYVAVCTAGTITAENMIAKPANADMAIMRMRGQM